MLLLPKALAALSLHEQVTLRMQKAPSSCSIVSAYNDFVHFGILHGIPHTRLVLIC